MLNHLQPILNLFIESTERKDGRSSQGAMLNHSFLQPAKQQNHVQPVIHYFNEQGQQRSTQSNVSQRSRQTNAKWVNHLHQLWKMLITIDTDPKVKQRVDSTGQMYWHVYDPVTDRHSSFLSEAEVYQWLESRYYQ